MHASEFWLRTKNVHQNHKSLAIFSQHGNHGRRPPCPLPPPIVLRRPFRHDRPLPHINYNVWYARFFMILSGGAGKTKFVSNHIFKGRIKNIHDNQMGFRHHHPSSGAHSSMAAWQRGGGDASIRGSGGSVKLGGDHATINPNNFVSKSASSSNSSKSSWTFNF